MAALCRRSATPNSRAKCASGWQKARPRRRRRNWQMHPHPRSVDPTFAAKARSTLEILRRVAAYLRPYKLMATATIACALLSLAFSLAYPKLTQFVVDEIIGHRR